MPASHVLQSICLKYGIWHAYTHILLNPGYYGVNKHSFAMSHPLGCFSKIRHFTSAELSLMAWPQSICFLYVFSLHPLPDKHAYHHICLFCDKYLVQYMILYESPFWNHDVMYLCSSLQHLKYLFPVRILKTCDHHCLEEKKIPKSGHNLVVPDVTCVWHSSSVVRSSL